MYNVTFNLSPKEGKRFRAVFTANGRSIKTVDFGSTKAIGRTYIDGASKRTRDNYIARHRVRENWNRPDTAGSLAKHIIWETPSLDANIELFKSKFNLNG